MRARRFAVLFGLVAVLAWAPTTSAAVPVTTIDIDVTFGVTLEPFTTSGGVLCASGDAISDPVSIRGVGRQGRGNVTFQVHGGGSVVGTSTGGGTGIHDDYTGRVTIAP